MGRKADSNCSCLRRWMRAVRIRGKVVTSRWLDPRHGGGQSRLPHPDLSRRSVPAPAR